MRSMRLRFTVASLSLLVAACGSVLAAGVGPAEASTHRPVGNGGGGGVWIQTMDSCKQALGGAAYTVSGGGASIAVSDPSTGAGSVGPSVGCPLQQGNCTRTSRGCASFAAPGPGTYTIRQTVTPPGNTTNPEGYAPCEGGSACRSEQASLTVGSGGGVSAIVTAVYPDGTTATWPSTGSYAGTPSDPIVFHDFGLAAPGSAHNGQCDGDGDADDHLTGTPSSHCAYPEAQEASACQPFPWSCPIGAGTPAGSPQVHRPGGGGSSAGGHSTAGSSGGGAPPSASGTGSRHNGSSRSFRSR
jgi:hypothetical protein